MSTAYMSLVLPVVGTTIGPLYATEVNTAFSTVDAHNHASGSGQQITPSGLNINADLTFASNNAIALRTVRFDNQSATLAAATDLGCLYVVSGELFYRDRTGGAGFAITNNGSVNAGAGSITGLPTGNAGAAYSAGTFVFTSNTNTPADINGASLFIREAAASSKYIKLASPGSLAADYTITLPSALPGTPTNATGKIMSMSTAGVVAVAYDVDASSLEISGSTMRVKAAGVTNAMLAASGFDIAKWTVGTVATAQIADAAVTQIKRGAASYDQQTITASTAFASGSGVSATITGVSRPVMISISMSCIGGDVPTLTTNGAMSLIVYKDGTPLKTVRGIDSATTSSIDSWNFIDTVGKTGSVTYTLKGDNANVGTMAANTTCTMSAVEL